MKTKLTAQSVKSLPIPKNGQIDYFDENGRYPGFSLRVAASGKRGWYLSYRFGKKQRRLKLGGFPQMSLADAREHAKKALRDLDDGIDPALERDEKKEALTFSDLCAEYVKRHASRKKSGAQDESIIRRELLPRWGKWLAGDIQRKHVIALHGEITERGPVLANRVIGVLSGVYSFGVKKALLDHQPCTLIERNKEWPRNRRLDDDELRAVWLACDRLSPFAKALFRIRILTGQRAEEISSAQWTDIDFTKGHWIIPQERTKTGIEHLVPLTPLALDILEELRPFSGSALLFPGRGDKRPHMRHFGRSLHRLRETSGVDFHGKDLRRTFASGLTEMGVPKLTVSRLLNHAAGDITGRHYDPYGYLKEKTHAMERWSRKLERLISS
jgi:integrase